MNWLNIVKNNDIEQKLESNTLKVNKSIIDNKSYYKNLFDTYLLDELLNNIIFLKEDLCKNFPYILCNSNTLDILKFILEHVDYNKTMYNHQDFNENLSDSDNEEFFEI